jgi:hypothetical protein
VSALVFPELTPSLETVGPGFAGFVAIFALALVTVLLLRSMVKHLRNVRYSPDPAAEEQQQGPEAVVPRADKPRDTRGDKPGDTPGDAPGGPV